jgi:dipeptidase
MREIWDWDDSIYLGKIPEVNHTYNVVGNINEHGLIIGETTFGGLSQLSGSGTGAIMDYGSLIWVTLQRAKTAREAIKTMDALCQEYGYASEGESFSIADKDEVWLMELIGKGKEKGAVWVASRVPEGHVGSTANQARTRTFARDDPDHVLYAADVVSFAKKAGLYPKDGRDEAFAFADVYDPITFTSARLAEARVWNLFRQVAGKELLDPYLDWAQGYNLSHPMPLFVPAASKLSVNDTMWHMRTHFEGTWFDNEGVQRKDVGAGPGNSPYRWRPLVWQHGGKSFVNERTIGVQQTAWNFVAQSRGALPYPVSALIWWAPDDSSTAVRIPVYGAATEIPPSFADKVGQVPAAATAYGPDADAFTMTMDSAFWVWNLVANMCYGERYRDVYPLVQAEIAKHEDRFFAEVAATDAKAAALAKKGDVAGATAAVTAYTVAAGEKMTRDWRQFWMFLFSRTRDGFTTTPSAKKQCVAGSGAYKGCTARKIPDTAATGYSDAWYGRIVADSDNADHYGVRVKDGGKDGTRSLSEYEQRKIRVMDKRKH